MKDKELTVGQTLQLLYKHGLSALPVVNESSQLIGTIEKAGLIRVAGLRSRLHDPLTQHLETFLVRAKAGDDVRLRRILFHKGESVPVINSAGRMSHYWHKTIPEAPAAGEKPMPYFGILAEAIRILSIPSGVILEGEPAVGVVNDAMLSRLGVADQEAFLKWSQAAHWRKQDDPLTHTVRVADAGGISITLIRRQIRVGEQLYGWLYCLQEEHDRRLAELLSDNPAQERGRAAPASLKPVLEAFERFALARCIGLKKPAAALFNRLGITRQGLMYKLKKFKLPRPRA